jgi:hypothetical protein
MWDNDLGGARGWGECDVVSVYFGMKMRNGIRKFGVCEVRMVLKEAGLLELRWH